MSDHESNNAFEELASGAIGEDMRLIERTVILSEFMSVIPPTKEEHPGHNLPEGHVFVSDLPAGHIMHVGDFVQKPED